MKKCTQCGFEQEDGKFCGKCGSPLAEVPPKQPNEAEKAEEGVPDNQTNEEVYQQPKTHSPEQEAEIAATMAQGDEAGAGRPSGETPPQGTKAENDTVERVKETSKEFWSYFIYYLKQPSHIFKKHKTEFVNGLINIIAMLILLSLSSYFLTKNFMMAASYGYVTGVPFFSIFGNTLFFGALFIVLIVAILFAINKLFGPGYSFKEILSIYGGHLSLATVLAASAFILLLVKANLIGMILIALVLGLAITSAPIYLISSLLTQKSKSLDPYYGYLIYTVAVGIGVFILFTILADSAIGGLLDDLSYYL